MLAPKHLVAVIWDDAHGDIIGDATEAEILRDFHAPTVYTTFGLMVIQDKEGVTLACDYCEGLYRGKNFIPAAMIREIVDFGIPKRPRDKRAKKARVQPTLQPTAVSGRQDGQDA